MHRVWLHWLPMETPTLRHPREDVLASRRAVSDAQPARHAESSATSEGQFASDAKKPRLRAHTPNQRNGRSNLPSPPCILLLPKPILPLSPATSRLWPLLFVRSPESLPFGARACRISTCFGTTSFEICLGTTMSNCGPASSTKACKTALSESLSWPSAPLQTRYHAGTQARLPTVSRRRLILGPRRRSTTIIIEPPFCIM